MQEDYWLRRQLSSDALLPNLKYSHTHFLSSFLQAATYAWGKGKRERRCKDGSERDRRTEHGKLLSLNALPFIRHILIQKLFSSASSVLDDCDALYELLVATCQIIPSYVFVSYRKWVNVCHASNCYKLVPGSKRVIFV
jgi:hypothetical protein